MVDGIRRYWTLSWHLGRAGYLSSLQDRVDLILGIVTNIVRQSVSLALIGIVLAHFRVLGRLEPAGHRPAERPALHVPRHLRGLSQPGAGRAEQDPPW
jgi:hypothetical protein